MKQNVKGTTPDLIGGEVKAFLRWAGSKRQLIPKLAHYWNSDYTRYVEPFAGSASLFFHIRPPVALLADINSELIATYCAIKMNPEAVVTELRPLRRGKLNYLRLRGIDPQFLSASARAARFIYLNRFCFNGLYRTNRAGQFNVPYSGSKTGKLPAGKLLTACSECLQRAELVVGSFSKTLEMVRRGDFVYLDPPFKVAGRRTFNEYDASTFSQEQLELLRSWMIKLDRMGITFLVSYADSDEGYYLSDGFHTTHVTVRRNIAGFSANRRRAVELLISNISPTDAGGGQ